MACLLAVSHPACCNRVNAASATIGFTAVIIRAKRDDSR